jgi:predicted transcriptional regulator
MNGFSKSQLADSELQLMKLIEINPGIRYRELMRLSGLANGILSYRLAALERAKALLIERRPGEVRYYVANFSSDDAAILSHLRNRAERRILSLLLKHRCCAFSDIVAETGKAPSTISECLAKLERAGLISIRRETNRKLYSVRNKDMIERVYARFMVNTLDKIVENYTQIVEEL